MKKRSKPTLNLVDKSRYNLFGVSYELWKSGLEDFATRISSRTYRVLIYLSRKSDYFIVLVRSSANTFYLFDSNGIIQTCKTVTETVTQTLNFFKGE